MFSLQPPHHIHPPAVQINTTATSNSSSDSRYQLPSSSSVCETPYSFVFFGIANVHDGIQYAHTRAQHIWCSLYYTECMHLFLFLRRRVVYVQCRQVCFSLRELSPREIGAYFVFEFDSAAPSRWTNGKDCCSSACNKQSPT